MRARRGRGSRRHTALPPPSQRQPLRFVTENHPSATPHISSPFHQDLLRAIEGRLPLPKETVKFATKLLDQQFWCWGQDVCLPQQNALLSYGFCRHASPPEKKQISHYVLTETIGPAMNPRSGRKIGLWGSGLFFGCPERGAIYIRRYTFAPIAMEYCCPIEAVGGPDEFPVPPHDNQQEAQSHSTLLLADLCQWLAQYEEWAQQQLGLRHRERCLREWKKTVAAATEIVPQWQRLARAFHECVSDSTEKRCV
jgi:hypothetical protein